MKTNKTILLASLVLLTSLNSFASSALYLTEGKLIDWVKEESAETFKIYGHFNEAPDKYKNRIVQKSEISLTTKMIVNGHKNGSWALAQNADGSYNHCRIDDTFENKKIGMFCDILANVEGAPGQKVQVRVRYLDDGAKFVAQLHEDVNGLSVDKKAILKKETITIKANEEVKIMAVFANGKVLVRQSGFYRNSPSEISMFSVVDASDLQL